MDPNIFATINCLRGRAPFVVFVATVVSVATAVCDQVVTVQHVDDIDEVHQLDPVHQVDHKDELWGDPGANFWCFFFEIITFRALVGAIFIFIDFH